MNHNHLFPQSYSESRARFLNSYRQVQAFWPDAERGQRQLAGYEDLSIDWIKAGALDDQDKGLIFTTGEHGIEGYVGSAMLQYFTDHYLEKLDPSNTGILLVHAINPWGMKFFRRTNAANVDLNRNFVWDSQALDPAFNPAQAELNRFFNPSKSMRSYLGSQIGFHLALMRILRRTTWENLKGTWLLGQYREPKGIHYGGDAIQEETEAVKSLYREMFQSYGRIVHLDMHTGYGPRYQMSLVNSVHETRESAEFVRRFDYPLVAAANPEEFYAISGDMIDYIYTLRDHEFPAKPLYATSFEFGTFGEQQADHVRNLRTLVFENQVYWYGAANPKTKQRAQQALCDMFYPGEQRWQNKAIEDAERAFRGILRAEKYLVE